MRQTPFTRWHLSRDKEGTRTPIFQKKLKYFRKQQEKDSDPQLIVCMKTHDNSMSHIRQPHPEFSIQGGGDLVHTANAT